jgi:hypothetical protein
MRSAMFFNRALGSALFTLALVRRLPAQAPVVIDLGIRGGALATDSFQYLQACCGVGAVLGGPSTFSSEQLQWVAGSRRSETICIVRRLATLAPRS